MHRRIVAACFLTLGAFGGHAWAWQVKPATDVPAKAREEMERIMRERAASGGQQPPAATAPSPTPVAADQPILAWTDAEFESFGKMLIGSWTSGSGEGGLLLNIARVGVPGLPDAMYCEVAPSGSPAKPFRQTVLSLHRVGGKVRLTTWEFRRPGGRIPSAMWAWAAPVAFPKLDVAEDLLGTLSLEFTSGGGSYVGRTSHPYPTGTAGALDMTSELVLRDGVLELADRGFDGSGAQVWGPPAGTRTSLTRTDAGMKVDLRPEGLASITMNTPLTGPVPANGDICTIHYAAYLENGVEYDSSYKRGAPFTYKQGQPLIPGWNMLNTDLQAGMVRRIFVPARFAWGTAGKAGQVPPNANVIYDIEVIKIEPAPPAPAEGAANDPPKLEIKPVEAGGKGPPPVKAVPVPDPK